MMSLNETIKITAQEMGVDFRDDYSGRGMYGKSCIGVTGSQSECMSVIAQVILQMQSDVLDTVEALDEQSTELDCDVASMARSDLESAVETLLHFEQDSMGLDIIVYWRGLEWQGDTQ